MSETYGEICNLVAESLSAATGITSIRSYGELTEAVPAAECPRLNVYPDSLNVDVRTSTDRTTFNAGFQQEEFVIIVDHLARPLTHINLDTLEMLRGLDSVVEILKSQVKPPFFGSYVIKSFKWNWKRAVIRYGDQFYRGGRFTLRLRIF